MLIASGFFVVHWIGDFLLQTSQMALNKSSSLKWLGLHILTYAATLAVGSLLLLSPELAWKFTLVNALLHGITDFFTSKLTARYHQNRRIFFVIIGFDQLIHALCLLQTLQYFLEG